MAFDHVDLPPYGAITVLAPTKPKPSSKLYGSHYLVDDSGRLRAWEYMETPGPDLSEHPGFVTEFCQVITQRGLQRKFGLSVKSTAEKGGWTEFEYPEKRATFLVPDSIPCPNPEGSFETPTEWVRECFRHELRDINYRHSRNYIHPGPRRNNSESIGLGQEVPDNQFVEGITSHDGLRLAGAKLDPESLFYALVAAITVGV